MWFNLGGKPAKTNGGLISTHNKESKTIPASLFIGKDKVVVLGETKDIDRTCSVPVDGDSDQIYSDYVATCKYSFLDTTSKYDKKAPPPLYEAFETMNEPKATEKEDVLKAFFVNKYGLLECNDQKIIDSNKGIIPYVLKQLAKNIFTGKGLVAISLPVRIFQPKSLLERIIDACSFVPTFFKLACETDDPVLRMKYTISFIVAGLYLSADLRKPFNPILGETLEGYFQDGSRIYMEHISHHPPISSYLIEGPAEYPYRMYGSVEFNGSIKSSGNILDIFFQGANYVEFPDGHLIEFHYPTTRVSGLMWGSRTVNMESTAILIDHNHDYKGIVVFNPKKSRFLKEIPPTHFEGLIYKQQSEGEDQVEVREDRRHSRHGRGGLRGARRHPPQLDHRRRVFLGNRLIHSVQDVP